MIAEWGLGGVFLSVTGVGEEYGKESVNGSM